MRKVDLSIELQILAFHAQRRGAGARPGDGGRDAILPARRLESVPAGHLGLDVAAELGVSGRLDVAAGLAGASTRCADDGPDSRTPDYTTGVQAVGT